ncbi:hypothetical protein N6L25_13335 [Marinobacter sp. SS21]|nr:hypothetical protein [Marinobacter sp. SS21]MDC0663544.1 hypothetical protein [Marinobacter sp. SS21]
MDFSWNAFRTLLLRKRWWLRECWRAIWNLGRRYEKLAGDEGLANDGRVFVYCPAVRREIQSAQTQAVRFFAVGTAAVTASPTVMSGAKHQQLAGFLPAVTAH